ncbi:sulfatase family protein [Algibacter pectinivorans]|uniref:Arylsulfatase A n=1 Tax=Algibacter pectinivorans TaxID=870482 RepID=A0A1I1R2B6_9FLAO|nr:arylsulfatase [Algibacter pectinivorans]SFD24400.1 Arylsulfatase A [Algibacter pectinivorans]
MKTYSQYSLNIVSLVLLLLFSISCSKSQNKKQAVSKKPNVIIVYMDDLGYGDVGFNGGKIPTPNMDGLAKGGLVFKNGYSSSATCTPSRYALLTGLYPWRKKEAKILPGSAPLLIDVDQQTLPKIMHNAGYVTGIIGKWHLGLGNGSINWNEQITPGPNELGFETSYIMAATQDRVPTVYIENGYVENLDKNDPIEVSYKENFTGEPTALDHPEMLKMKWHHTHNNSIVNGIPRIGFMKGGNRAKWVDSTMSKTFLNKAQNFVKENKDKPFFMYYALQQPHVPRTPHPKFVGKSGMGPRGDVIVEADWTIGQLMKTLKNEKLLENTLIIFSSDNGPVLNDGYYDEAVEKNGHHSPWGPFRGGKYSLFQAGTHVPFVTYWKGKIKPGTSNALVSQLDLMASLSSLVQQKIPETDSENLLNTFLGKSNVGREEIIIEAMSRTALRKGDWVMIPPYKGPKVLKNQNIETGNSKEYQLYNLSEDASEQFNLAQSNSTKLNEMIEVYKIITGKD